MLLLRQTEDNEDERDGGAASPEKKKRTWKLFEVFTCHLLRKENGEEDDDSGIYTVEPGNNKTAVPYLH